MTSGLCVVCSIMRVSLFVCWSAWFLLRYVFYGIEGPSWLPRLVVCEYGNMSLRGKAVVIG